jgi:predicted nucleic acid-binding Zn ribbon protein
LDPFGGLITRTARTVFEKRAPEPPPLPVRASAALERQEEIVTQMAALQEKQDAAQATAAARAAEISWTDSTRTASGPSAWRNDLRSPADLRRAIVLRELLGPPLALRRGHDSAFS